MKKYFSLAGLFSVLGLPLTSWAQTGQIIYQPSAAAIPPTAVPTLTTTALLLLVILIILAARWAGFGRNRLMSLFAGMLGVCALASGGLSMKLVSDAWADGGGGTNFAFFSSASGGSTPVNDNVLNIFENTSGVNQRIVSIIRVLARTLTTAALMAWSAARQMALSRPVKTVSATPIAGMPCPSSETPGRAATALK